MDVLDAIRARASTRAFTDDPVPRELITEVLDAARWAPSGANTQPWSVSVVSGATRERLEAALLDARNRRQPPEPDYQYYPSEWYEPYRERRFRCGMALYQALDIGREDKQRRLEQWNRNYALFGAPVGLFFFIDRRLAQGSWVDMGMFIQSVMLAAVGRGLATCPQAALAEYPALVREVLSVPHEQALVCGMALGFADPNHPVNQFRTERAALKDFVRWHE